MLARNWKKPRNWCIPSTRAGRNSNRSRGDLPRRWPAVGAADFPRLASHASLDADLSSSLFSEQTLPAEPGVGARLLVGIFCIGGFAGTHESVSRAVVSYSCGGFAGRLHLSDGIWNGCVDACIIPGIEAVDRGFDARHGVLLRRPAVENKSGRQIAAIRSEPESLTAAPAVATNEELATRC